MSSTELQYIHDDISDYVNEFFKTELYIRYNLPLIAFGKSDADLITSIISKTHDVEAVVKRNNVQISCKHFPYMCQEVAPEHYIYSYDTCECKNLKYELYCRDDVPLSRSYRQFNQFEISGNCDDECCCFIIVPERITIFVKEKKISIYD